MKKISEVLDLIRQTEQYRNEVEDIFLQMLYSIDGSKRPEARIDWNSDVIDEGIDVVVSDEKLPWRRYIVVPSDYQKRYDVYKESDRTEAEDRIVFSSANLIECLAVVLAMELELAVSWKRLAVSGLIFAEL